MDRELDK
jgi:hypothetical protein